MWGLIVRTVGGVHEMGRLSLVIHDQGWYFAVDRIVRAEWQRSIPAKP